MVALEQAGITSKRDKRRVNEALRKADIAWSKHRPLYLELNEEFITEARNWVRHNFGYEVESRLSNDEVARAYLNPTTLDD